MSDIEIGLNVTNTRTQAEGPEFRVGTTAATTDTSGVVREYIYVSATAAPTAAGYIMIVHPTTFAADMITNTNALAGIGWAVGSPVAVIPAGGYGWLQIYGPGSFRAAAAVTAGIQLNTSGAAGALSNTLTAATTAQVAGIGNPSTQGGSGVWPCWLNYPFVLKAQQ